MEGTAESTVTKVEKGKAAAAAAASAGVERNERVKIRVERENTQDVVYCVKRNAPLGKLMSKYCEAMGLNDKELKFCYLQKQIKFHDTPDSLSMEDGEDVIDCWSDQHGGTPTAPLS